MSLSGPATAWAWTQWNISGETWKCEQKNQTKKTWDCKGASAKYVVKGMNTYAMYLFSVFYIKYIYEVVTVLFLLCQYGVWSVDWLKKSNLKQFNMRQHHNKTWKK